MKSTVKVKRKFQEAVGINIPNVEIFSPEIQCNRYALYVMIMSESSLRSLCPRAGCSLKNYKDHFLVFQWPQSKQARPVWDLLELEI